MDITFRTGFEKIYHSLQVNPQSEIRGVKLLNSGHVVQVEELRRPGWNPIIRGKLIRQAEVSADPYRVELHLDSERMVQKVFCTCVYKESEICKHVLGLIAFVNTEESKSKTNNQQSWGMPSLREYSKQKYSKGKYFAEMRPPQKNPSKISHPVACNLLDPLILLQGGLVDPSPLRLAVEQMQRDPEQLSMEVRQKREKIIADKQRAKRVLQEKCKSVVSTFPLFAQNYKLFTNEQIIVIEEKFLEFYFEKILLNSDQICNLASETVKQSECDKWHEARKLRITASKNVHSIKSRRNKSIKSLVEEIIEPKKVNVESTRYGIASESRARQKYSEIYHQEVVDIGLLVSVHQPWLCVSVDGAVVNDTRISKIVEIKCPNSCKKKPVIDYQEKKCNVKYLEFKNGEVVLKESHLYYTQCQVQLYVTGLNICDFFIYSPINDGSHRVIVTRNDNFLLEVILKCETFYFTYVLPVLYQKNFEKVPMEY